jgi:hypothetical protein
MKTFKQFFTEQQQSKTAVFAYGRFNPPTIGHETLVDKVKQIAGNNDAFIIPTHTSNDLTKTPPSKWTNPLTFEQKLPLIKKAFETGNVKILETGDHYVNALKDLASKGYTNVIQIAGSDRVANFEGLRDQYNGKPNKEGVIEFSFAKFDIISSGERDPDSEGISGVSASKVRAAALEEPPNIEYIKNALPDSIKDKTDYIIDIIRKDRDLFYSKKRRGTK